MGKYKEEGKEVEEAWSATMNNYQVNDLPDYPYLSDYPKNKETPCSAHCLPKDESPLL